VVLLLSCFFFCQAFGQEQDALVQTSCVPAYQPVKDGYRIYNSSRYFNRTLYGGHSQDPLPERFFTFAGDQPVIMGAITDWRKEAACKQAKCGTLMAGLCYTPGSDLPRYSAWFHQMGGTLSTFRNGWMEYDLNTYLQCFPVARVNLEVLPLESDAGFLVHIKLLSDQRVILVLGFGGITDFLGRFEYPDQEHREFSEWDCRENTIIAGKNRALLRGPEHHAIQTSMQIGTTFPMDVRIVDAKQAHTPAFLCGTTSDPVENPMVCMTAAIGQNQSFEGCVVILRNGSEADLDRWLHHSNPVEQIKQGILQKRSAMQIDTPDPMLNQTVPSNVMAMDACWHENTFYHGAFSWHAPYLGWRNWYGPTVLGWHDRVQKAFLAHAATQVPPSDQPESLAFNEEKGNSMLRNSYGYLPCILDGKQRISYNMQEVAVDMILHNIEWTGNLEYARQIFDNLSKILAWETRILDPENNGLYQNWLNTWISDAHAYNGGDCAQASAYNYRAHLFMANIAERIGRDPEPFRQRAEQIRDAFQNTLWIPEKGIVAEYKDTLGNKLLHPAPELATAYHSIEAGIVDPFQAYQMLRFTETQIPNTRPIARGGRLAFSSNWFPHLYSSYGLYPAENMHLAWAYFQIGQIPKAHELLTALVDAHFLGHVPGTVCHGLAPTGFSYYIPDFTDICSMHLRLIVEGLFGIRRNLLDRQITVAPAFPPEWDHANLKIPDGDLRYQHSDHQISLGYCDSSSAVKTFSLPLPSASIDNVTLNDQRIDYSIEPAIGSSRLIVKTEQAGPLQLQLRYKPQPVPELVYPSSIPNDSAVAIQTQAGEIVEWNDPSGCLQEAKQSRDSLSARLHAEPGNHTVFLRVKHLDWDGWLPADLVIPEPSQTVLPPPVAEKYQPLDITGRFNIALADIHQQQYRNPRPQGHSLMCSLNGRFGWSWNHAGQRVVKVDDTALRTCNGTWRSPSGIPFLTPSDGPNAACVSIWENFPKEISFNLAGRAVELAILFVGVTNPMQAHVENARFTVEYADGSTQSVLLVNPLNIDDWLTAACQSQNESQYFSDYNHAIIQRIPLDPEKELKALRAVAVANEVIVGILGLSLRNP